MEYKMKQTTFFRNQTDILLPRNDRMFKRIFADRNNVDILTDFLKTVLDIPEDEYDEIIHLNPTFLGRNELEKQGIVDVRVVTKSGKNIDVELQVAPYGAIWSRILYYTTRMFIDPVRKGEKYDEIPQAISILIYFPELIPGDKIPHHKFQLYDIINKLEYPNSIEIHTLEIQKSEYATQPRLKRWLKFLGANSREEIEMESNNDSTIKKAATIVKEFSKDELEILRKFYQDKAELDAANYDHEYVMNYWRQEGLKKGIQEGIEEGREEGRIEAERAIARKLIQKSVPLEEISEYTGLSLEELGAILRESEK